MDWPESLPFTVWLLLHAGGLAAVCLSRFSLGLRTDAAVQVLAISSFFSVAGVAVLTGLEGGDQLRLWVLSGTTLGMMIVVAVLDRGVEVHDPLLRRFAALDEQPG